MSRPRKRRLALAIVDTRLHMAVTCRECDRTSLVAFGLCRRCYQWHWNRARQGKPHERVRRGLTARDLATGPAYYVVGVRPGGARLILGEARSLERAQRRRDHFAVSGLEGYRELVVERAGDGEPCH